MARKVLKQLAAHGCENLTDHIDRDSFSALPFYDGGFGDVYHGKLFSGLQVAVKVPRVSLRILEENPDYLTDVAREIHSWKKCDHPNVLHFLGLAEFRGQIGMVAPWMENGSLPRYLEKAFDADRCKLCTQICEGVAYLHEIGIVHGDLKGENVLISSKGVAVVADFGGSLLKNRSLKIVPPERGLCFSIRWAAPELLGGDQEGVNTKESDIYALGMVCTSIR
ncbi:tyrosine kinase domain protein [Rhizoctonia solani AG-3 Rhs1AP]|uniref:Tyrosine kinase domain protein n=2 Tax=Rhizoctonia solani AG-3 TaxID=1086053 RepID=A0A074RHS8_9AGAM|nr:tyrosine kinase domain protein [Rhizoctonia solani AG-3 Rhs1AP]KEP46324.1 tyrosine kinase domain protein [Rhizoctonia solani 123E]